MTRQNSPKISFQVGCVPIVINTNVVCSGRILLEVREFFWWQSLSIVVVKPVTLKIRIELEFGNTGCWEEGETWESEKKNSRSCKDEEQDRNKDKCSHPLPSTKCDHCDRCDLILCQKRTSWFDFSWWRRIFTNRENILVVKLLTTTLDSKP